MSAFKVLIVRGFDKILMSSRDRSQVVFVNENPASKFQVVEQVIPAKSIKELHEILFTTRPAVKPSTPPESGNAIYDTIVAAVNAGMKKAEIASLLGVSVSTINRILKDSDYVSRLKPAIRNQIEKNLSKLQ